MNAILFVVNSVFTLVADSIFNTNCTRICIHQALVITRCILVTECSGPNEHLVDCDDWTTFCRSVPTLCNYEKNLADCYNSAECCECNSGHFYNGSACVRRVHCTCMDKDGIERQPSEQWSYFGSCDIWRCLDNHVEIVGNLADTCMQQRCEEVSKLFKLDGNECTIHISLKKSTCFVNNYWSFMYCKFAICYVNKRAGN